MTRRKIQKMFQIVRRTRVTSDLWLYVKNKIKKFRLQIAQSTEVAYPSTIMMELTNQCNLQCSICPRQYAYGRDMDKGIMPLDKAIKIVDEVYPYLDSIGLTGLGETFLCPYLAELVSYIKSKKKSIVISLSTNANVAGFVENAKKVMPYVDTIQISIDGVGELYEKIRVGAKFIVFENNLKQLVDIADENNVDLMLNIVITKENYYQMDTLIEFAHAQGIKYVHFSYFNLASVTDIDREYYKFYQTFEFESALAEAYRMAKKYREVEVTGLDFRGNSGFKKCPFPWSHFYITWDGWIVPCCAKPFPKILNFGNVFDNGVMPILNSDKYQQFRKQSLQNKTPEFCDKCHYIEL